MSVLCLTDCAVALNLPPPIMSDRSGTHCYHVLQPETDCTHIICVGSVSNRSGIHCYHVLQPETDCTHIICVGSVSNRSGIHCYHALQPETDCTHIICVSSVCNRLDTHYLCGFCVRQIGRSLLPRSSA